MGVLTWVARGEAGDCQRRLSSIACLHNSNVIAVVIGDRVSL